MFKLKQLRPSARIPANATAGSAGYDLCADIDGAVSIAPGETAKIPTGLALQLEEGFAGFVFARSGLGIKHGIVPANCVGVIDSDYRGEVIVGLHNQSRETFTVSPADRIAQLVIMPVVTPQFEVCDQLDDTSRGTGGFGSTGMQ